jgi:hypothetical protein
MGRWLGNQELGIIPDSVVLGELFLFHFSCDRRLCFPLRRSQLRYCSDCRAFALLEEIIIARPRYERETIEVRSRLSTELLSHPE